MRQWLILAGAALLLAACGQAGNEEAPPADSSGGDAAAEGAQAPGRSAAAPGSEGAGKALPVSLPRIAYTYGYTFRLASGAVSRVQERHLQLCQQLGPARCRVVNLERVASSGDYLTATTTLQVAAPIARAFGERLVASATEAGADNIDRTIAGEDLSRQMIDTEARIRTREALIRRLTVLLETRSGNIGEAVEAERAISTAQEELDAARGWLAEMRTRVDMTTFTLRYQSGAPLSDSPVKSAWGRVGSLFGQSVAALILFVAAVLPWALLGWGIFYAARAVRRRRRTAAPGAAGGASSVPPADTGAAEGHAPAA